MTRARKPAAGRNVRALVYGVLATLAFVLLWPLLMLSKKLRPGQGQRFGRLVTAPRSTAARIWLHGASAGDVKALAPLAAALRARLGRIELHLSTRTSTGFAMAQRLGDRFDAVSFVPYDLPLAVDRTFATIDPDLLVLEYTEIWPRLLTTAQRRRVPVVLHNGTLSPGHMPGYRLQKLLTGTGVHQLEVLLMRDAAGAERAVSLGADPNRVEVTGNTKFDDLRPPPAGRERAELRAAARFPAEAPVWLAASVHPGEEKILFDILFRIYQTNPHTRAIVAPRYPERAARAAQTLRRCGLEVALRSAGVPAKSPDVFMLDTMGELAAWFAAADVAFVGGTLVRRGGHNVLEPAAAACPVVVGPHLGQIDDLMSALAGPGLTRALGPEDLATHLSQRLADAGGARRDGAALRARAAAHAGAATRNAEFIAQRLLASTRARSPRSTRPTRRPPTGTPA